MGGARPGAVRPLGVVCMFDRVGDNPDQDPTWVPNPKADPDPTWGPEPQGG